MAEEGEAAPAEKLKEAEAEIKSASPVTAPPQADAPATAKTEDPATAAKTPPTEPQPPPTDPKVNAPEVKQEEEEPMDTSEAPAPKVGITFNHVQIQQRGPLKI